jgi:hypothetical protein
MPVSLCVREGPGVANLDLPRPVFLHVAAGLLEDERGGNHGPFGVPENALYAWLAAAPLCDGASRTHVDLRICLQNLKEAVQGGLYRLSAHGMQVAHQLTDGFFRRRFLRHVSYLGEHVVHLADTVKIDESVVRRRPKVGFKARRWDDEMAAIDPFELNTFDILDSVEKGT